VLLKTIANLDNAVDTRHAAAVALRELDDVRSHERIRTLAAEYPEVSTRRVLQEALLRLADELNNRGHEQALARPRTPGEQVPGR